MKKTLLFAALMCCIVSASAQQTKNEPKEMQSLKDRIQQVERLNRHENQFTQKLDSVTGEEARFLYEYDNRLNCTKEKRYYPSSNSWYLDQSFENTYDELNRLTSVTHQQLSSIIRTEYTYNEQSLVVEEVYSYPSGDGWKQYNKGTFEYDEDGNVTLFVVFNNNDGWEEYSKLTYEYENGLLQNEMYYEFIEGDWQPRYYTEYFYNAQSLCTQVVSSMWEGEWYYASKTEYEYNEQGLCIEMVHYGHLYSDDWVGESRYTFEYDSVGKCLSVISYGHSIGSQVWGYDYKYEYIYDANGNCTAYNTYDFWPDDWLLEDNYEMTYDFTVSIDQTAGLNRFWEAMEIAVPIPDMKIDIPVYNKLLQINLSDKYGDNYLIDLHYSDYNGIAEPTESPIAVWPNPATEVIHIEGLEANEAQVYNAFGQLVKTVRDANEIPVAGLAEGVYLVRIMDSKGVSQTERITVIR